MLRLPRSLLDIDIAAQYCVDEQVAAWTSAITSPSTWQVRTTPANGWRMPKVRCQPLLLADLRALADRDGHRDEFVRRCMALRQEHSRKPSLIGRLNRAGIGIDHHT